MPARKKTVSYKAVETIKHDDAKRKNIPSAEQQSIVQKEHEQPKTIRYPRSVQTGRNGRFPEI